jgi:hypothetical protein
MKNTTMAYIKNPISNIGHPVESKNTALPLLQLNPVKYRTITHRIIPIKYPIIQIISFPPLLFCYILPHSSSQAPPANQ